MTASRPIAWKLLTDRALKQLRPCAAAAWAIGGPAALVQVAKAAAAAEIARRLVRIA
jgi:hypothetical protein